MRFLSSLHLHLFCEKNSDGTRYLTLHGKELYQRYGRRIEDDDMEALVKFLCKRSNIIKLNLCYNNIGDKGIKILVENYLMKKPRLQQLILTGCNIEWEGMKYICSAAKQLQLKSLRLNGNKLGTKGGLFVGILCEEYLQLEHLDVAECDLTLQTVNYLINCFCDDQATGYSLKILDLSRLLPDTRFQQFFSTNFANSLFHLFTHNNTLVELHIQKCELDGHDIGLIFNGLLRNSTLKFLDIGYNRIGNHGADNIAAFLKEKPGLIGLNIAGNGISDHGANSLFFAIPYSKLRLLDLSNNHIQDEGIYNILKSIRKPYIMRYLFLFGNTNSISQRTAGTLAKMLQIGMIPQDCIDLKVFRVNKEFTIGFNPINRYKHRYYCELDFGYPQDIKIKKNDIIPENEFVQPREKVNFLYYDRQPPVEKDYLNKIRLLPKPKPNIDPELETMDFVPSFYTSAPKITSDERLLRNYMKSKIHESHRIYQDGHVSEVLMPETDLQIDSQSTIESIDQLKRQISISNMSIYSATSDKSIELFTTLPDKMSELSVHVDETIHEQHEDLDDISHTSIHSNNSGRSSQILIKTTLV